MFQSVTWLYLEARNGLDSLVNFCHYMDKNRKGNEHYKNKDEIYFNCCLLSIIYS